MTLSVTIERFFAIVYPLRRTSLTSPLIVGSIVFSMLYNIPRFMEFEMTHRNYTDTQNQTIEVTVFNPSTQNRFHEKVLKKSVKSLDYMSISTSVKSVDQCKHMFCTRL